jgi:hypothetical protein
MLEPDYYVIEFHLYPDAPSEDMWSIAQAQGAWLHFSAVGDVVVCFDSRNSASTWFALQWATWIGRVKREAWYAGGPAYQSRSFGKLSA